MERTSKTPSADVEDRDVERAAAEVEDGDLLVLLLVQPVGQGRGGRLVDDPRDLQAGDLAGVLGGLPLAVVEVGRDRDDRLADLVAEVALGGLLELAEDHGRDLRRRVVLAVDLDLDEVVGPADDLVGDHLLFGLDLVVAAAHEPLDRVDRPPGVGDRLPLGRLADQDLALVGEGDDDGVSRFPSWLGMTVTSPPSITATTLLVVPRSMPMIFSPSATTSLLSHVGAGMASRRLGTRHVPRLESPSLPRTDDHETHARLPLTIDPEPHRPDARSDRTAISGQYYCTMSSWLRVPCFVAVKWQSSLVHEPYGPVMAGHTDRSFGGRLGPKWSSMWRRSQP